MSSLKYVFDDFKQGFGIVVSRIFESGYEVIAKQKIKPLMIGIIISFLVVFIVTIPIRIFLSLLEFIFSLFSLSAMAQTLSSARSSMTVFNVLFDAIWYIPLFILCIYRGLGLFSNAPFQNQIIANDKAFGQKLLNAAYKQTAFSSFKHLCKRIIQLLAVSILLFLMRLIPGIRYFASLIVFVFEIYQKVFRVNHHLNNLALTLIGIAFIALFSDWTAKMVIYGCQFYLTSIALSREFMSPYFNKLSYKKEKKQKQKCQWLLFGFGCAVSLFFVIPIFGLFLYPIMQMAAADLLIVMMRQKNISLNSE